MSTKEMPTHMEDAIAGDEKLRVDKDTVGVTGTVQLTAGKIVYIPAPTADPRGSSPISWMRDEALTDKFSRPLEHEHLAESACHDLSLAV
jgi:hypothetical protein